jgi:hypothetical protein
MLQVLQYLARAYYKAGRMKEAKATKPSYVAGAAVPCPSLLQGWQDEGGQGHPSQGPPSCTTGTVEEVTISNVLLWGLAVRYLPDPDP